MDLLTAKLCALVLKDLLLKGWCKVCQIGVSARSGQHNVVTLPANQLDDQVFGLGGGGADQAGVGAKAHTELDLIP